MYSTDQPISNPVEDRYSRTPFADGIAKAIVSLPPGNGFVIGIHGPWGDGKTSVLRFVEHSLQHNHATSVVWFNPWRVGKEEEVFLEFFHVLASALNAPLSTKFESAVSALVKYANLLRPLGPIAMFAANTVAPGVSQIVNGPAVVDATRDWASQFQGPTVEQQRDRLRDELMKLDRKIVVFIDDIDRLDSLEVATLFRLIKACADFPNVIYVLAFDRVMVSRILGDRLAEGGEHAGQKYLEKIIQIPVSLPPASRSDLDRVCMKGIDEILNSSSQVLTDQEMLRWHWAYQEGISRRLRTPRQVAQYLNAVRFAMPLLQNEVNTVDLLLVEALRVCYPAAYEVVRDNQRQFVGVSSDSVYQKQKGTFKSDPLDSAKAQLSLVESAGLDSLVERLFPLYHVSKQGLVLGTDSIKSWTRSKLVCSPAYGPRYFSYAIGSSDVADADIHAILDASANGQTTQLRTLLAKQMEPLKQAVLILKLDERSPPLPAASAQLALTLATLSDRFEEPFSMHDLGHSGIAAGRLAARLCHAVKDEAARANAASQVVSQSAEIWFAVAFMNVADPRGPATERGVPLLGSEQLPVLRKAFLARYESLVQAAISPFDLQHRWKFEMLYTVAQAGGRQIVSDRFVPSMASDGGIAIRMLQCIAQPISASDQIIPTPGDFDARDLESLELLVDVDQMAKIVFEHWIGAERKKGPADWSAMKPDDRLLAQFWHFYSERERIRPGKSNS